jgi:hypothetical protein
MRFGYLDPPKQRHNLPQTRIMFQDVVVAECIEAPSRGVRCQIRCESEIEEQLCEIIADIEARREGVFDYRKSEVAPFVGEEAVVCQRVQHGTWASSWNKLVNDTRNTSFLISEERTVSRSSRVPAC